MFLLLAARAITQRCSLPGTPLASPWQGPRAMCGAFASRGAAMGPTRPPGALFRPGAALIRPPVAAHLGPCLPTPHPALQSLHQGPEPVPTAHLELQIQWDGGADL